MLYFCIFFANNVSEKKIREQPNDYRFEKIFVIRVRPSEITTNSLFHASVFLSKRSKARLHHNVGRNVCRFAN